MSVTLQIKQYIIYTGNRGIRPHAKNAPLNYHVNIFPVSIMESHYDFASYFDAFQPCAIL